MKGDIMNNIPQFLEHLPIWKANPLDQVKATKQIKKVKPVKAHQYDVADRIPNHFVNKICPVCGTSYKVEYRLRDINKTCSRSCGQKMRMARKEPETWIEKAIKLRKQGVKLSAIAQQVDRSISTVWSNLKKRGFSK